MTRAGFVLPSLLGALLVIGVISFAMSLVATLESLAAKSAAGAVEARAQAVGAVALALGEVIEQEAGGSLPDLAGPGAAEEAQYGPWVSAGVSARATLSLASAAVGEPTGDLTRVPLRLRAEVVTQRAEASASLVFVLSPELVVLERRLP